MKQRRYLVLPKWRIMSIPVDDGTHKETSIVRSAINLALAEYKAHGKAPVVEVSRGDQYGRNGWLEYALWAEVREVAKDHGMSVSRAVVALLMRAMAAGRL